MSDLANKDEQATRGAGAVPRDERGRILKGYSGNPSGRPRSFASAMRAELGSGERLWKRMLRIWEGEEEGFGPRERMEAGKWLSDRAFGRVAETQIQIQAEASEVEGATEAAADALLSLADDLSEDLGSSGGTNGGIPDVSAETH